MSKVFNKNAKKFYVMVDSGSSERIKSKERLMQGAGETYILRNIYESTL